MYTEMFGFGPFREEIRGRLRGQIEELRSGLDKVSRAGDRPDTRWAADVYRRNIAWRERLLTGAFGG